MTTDRSIAALAISMLVVGTARAQDQLLPFRDSEQGQWGYKRPDGSVAIPPRYLGAVFREGQAPVKDADGFAMIDAIWSTNLQAVDSKRTKMDTQTIVGTTRPGKGAAADS